ncbi:hypothetical protein N7462_000057 [Penicillium macrosclerotiorum]|uniref:uncharacterized protein n=1 Tax=Penicillium macrosclerotiorum TaxID=303699 RepID=UPI0025468BD0|nr:uncharacterized protein N7462_000057 [Penicillium macrosclerotiorum]KAJ5698052.1 hypothetical protein N7462_000057 [Penicillium macrosclerotiorum]
MAVYIEPARFPADTAAIHSLFSGYAASLGIDLTFQSFQQELDSLPGTYAESQGGTLLIARAQRAGHPHRKANSGSTPDHASLAAVEDSSAVGCVALRRSSDNWCEMKRLYVVPETRGLHLGEKLVQSILAQAKALGYRGVRLDTLPDMAAAQRLYRRHGFVQIEPYYDTPIKGTIFMGCEFTQS